MMEGFSQIIVDAERVLEDTGKLLRRLQSREYRRSMRKLYSNRRAMKKMVLRQEPRLARCLDSWHESAADDGGCSRLESEMEWFLTWRLKLADFPETMWCDGVQVVRLTREGGRSFRIQARIWIGPERDVSIEYLRDLAGTITLSQNRRRLKSYRLEIRDNGRTFWLRKAT